MIIDSPMFFFSGIFFPLDRFPPAAQAIARFLPLTPAVNLSRALIRGSVGGDLIWDLLALVVSGCVFFLFALHRMKRRIIR